MIQVMIEDLKAGMVLAQPVYNHQDVLLLEAGARISKKNIRIFKSWGIHRVYVKGSADTSESAAAPPVVGVAETVATELMKKFSDVLDDPIMLAIFKAARNRLIQNLPANENENEPS